jgi:hypothetical protein
MLSFVATKDATAIEVDLGLFFRRSMWDRSRSDLVFVECTSHGSIEKKDVLRMMKLADAFPGAVLAFATLNPILNTKEIALLQALVRRSRKRQSRGKLYNPILVLTETELFASFRLTTTWQEKGGLHKKLSDFRYRHDRLAGLADATQQLYLGMDPWSEVVQKQMLVDQAGKRLP